MAQPLDNGRTVASPTWGTPIDKVMTFAGGTTNDPGDHDGTGNPATLFTVTGTVRMRLLAKCTTSLTGASATVEVGTTLSTAGLIALTTGTDIDVNEIWHDNAPDSSIELTSVLGEKTVSDDVIQTVKTANVTAGVILYTCIWYPLSENALVVAA